MGQPMAVDLSQFEEPASRHPSTTRKQRTVATSASLKNTTARWSGRGK